MRKKGAALVIATIILIALVITIAAVIIIWSKGITESITGGAVILQGKNIALTCNDVIFDFSYTEGKIYLKNPGNVPIYGVKFIIHSDFNVRSEIQDVKDLIPNWPEDGLKPGRTFSGNITFDADVNKLVLIPVLIGKTSSGEESEYVCEKESQTLLLI